MARPLLQLQTIRNWNFYPTSILLPRQALLSPRLPRNSLLPNGILETPVARKNLRLLCTFLLKFINDYAIISANVGPVPAKGAPDSHSRASFC